MNKKPDVILKLDSEKVYDRVNWDFLFEVLKSRDFSQTWCDWIEKVFKGGSIGIILNGEERSFFKLGKGLRQGDPLCPVIQSSR